MLLSKEQQTENFPEETTEARKQGLLTSKGLNGGEGGYQLPV